MVMSGTNVATGTPTTKRKVRLSAVGRVPWYGFIGTLETVLDANMDETQLLGRVRDLCSRRTSARDVPFIDGDKCEKALDAVLKLL